ncbi:MAG: cytosine permease [Verrucomicrobia bacterium]|nr:cytosine permease [Verrucomicrobiota bacterium]
MKQGWTKLTAIQVGGAVCLPPIVVGQMLSENYGFMWAVIAVLLGNAVLLGVGLVSATAGFKLGLSTPELAEKYLGKRGAKLFAGAFLFATTGWFAIQLNLMAEAIHTVIGIPVPLIAVVTGGAMTLLALGGIGVIGRLATFCMPLLLATMVLAALRVTPQEGTMNAMVVSGLAISTVIATAIGAAFNLPTYFRHAKSQKDVGLSVVLTFGVALPLIELLGVYVATGAPGMGLIAALKGSGGALWGYWIVFFLVLAGWTTNNNNLYSAATCLHLLIPKWSQSWKMGVLGVVGSCLAALPLLDHLPLVLKVIGVIVTSGGAVTITAYLTGQRVPFVLCLVGCVAGWVNLSGIPAIDAAVASSLITSAWVLGRKYVAATP